MPAAIPAALATATVRPRPSPTLVTGSRATAVPTPPAKAAPSQITSGPPWPVPLTLAGADLMPLSGTKNDTSEWLWDGTALVAAVNKLQSQTWKRVARAGSAFGVEATARQLIDVTNGDGGYYGLVLDETETVQHVLLVNTRYQTWVIESYYTAPGAASGGWSNKRWKKSTAIQIGTNTNVLRADYVRGTVGVTINGQAVGSEQIDGINPGIVGIVAGSFDKAGYRVAFDRFVAFNQ
jgi:hypothetical protein